MRTRGQADSGTVGWDNISRRMHSNAHRKNCAATERKGGRVEGGGWREGRGRRLGHEACMSFGMNEVKFTVVHSLSKTKSLSSWVWEGRPQVSGGVARVGESVVRVLHVLRAGDYMHSFAWQRCHCRWNTFRACSNCDLQELNQCKSINGSPVRSSLPQGHASAAPATVQAAHALNARRPGVAQSHAAVAHVQQFRCEGEEGRGKGRHVRSSRHTNRCMQ